MNFRNYLLLLFILINIVPLNSAIKSQLIKVDKIADGIEYKNYLMGKRKHKINVNVVEVDLKKARLELLKGKQNIVELERISDMVDFYNSTYHDSVLAAVNASFWQAGTNKPIGCTLNEGEIIQQNSYKQWSSLFLGEDGVPYIDTFKITTEIEFRKIKYEISAYNYRKDSLGFVLYNRFGGDTIPYISPKQVSKVINNLAQNFDTEDDTELFIDTINTYSILRDSIANLKIERNHKKFLIKYLETPKINHPYIGKVIAEFDSVAILEPNTMILSIGKEIPNEYYPQIGDGILISVFTNIHTNKHFEMGLSATPRLVRKGKAQHEAYLEGSKGKRFIRKDLARTAVGYNQSKSKFYLVTVSPTIRSLKQKGATLAELSLIMKEIGCYDAMNFDGGGSATMQVLNNLKSHSGVKEHSRRITTALGIIKK